VQRRKDHRDDPHAWAVRRGCQYSVGARRFRHEPAVGGGPVESLIRLHRQIQRTSIEERRSWSIRKFFKGAGPKSKASCAANGASSRKMICSTSTGTSSSSWG